MNFRQRRYCQHGASLVEVMVATLLFALGTFAVLTMTTSSFQVNTASRSVDEASNLARTTLERLLTLPYDDPLLRDNNADGLGGLQNRDNATADYHQGNAQVTAFVADYYTGFRYRVFWNVANNSPVSGSKTISVVVTWQGSPEPRRVVFQTVRSEP